MAERKAPENAPVAKGPGRPPGYVSPLDSPEALQGVETACTVLDNEIDRLTRILGAREELSHVTTQVRGLLATVQPLQERREALAAENQGLEDHQKALKADVVKAEASHAARVKQFDDDVAQQKDAVEAARQAMLADKQALDAERQTLRRQYDEAAAQAEAQHKARLQAMQEHLADLQRQIHEAQALRDRLTALRE